MSLTPIDTVSTEVASAHEEGVDGQRPRAAIEGRSPFRLALARLLTDRVAFVALAMIVLMALLAIAAPLISAATGHNPYNPDLVNGTNSFGQPYGPGQNGFLLGTDNVGRDILVRIAYGARISLLVGVLATVIASIGGTVIGLFSGYFGGWIDALLARMMDAVLSFPYVLGAIVLAAVFGASLLLTIWVIAFFSWAAIGRIVRGQTLSQKEKEYVEAARSIGSGSLRIMFIDILPNLVAPVIVLGTLLVPAAIVFEATLDYLGVGVGPPTPTWGNMLADAQGSAGFGAWWFWIFPSIALLITTLGFNLLGDSVRDALDPRTERIFATRRKVAVAVAGPPGTGESPALESSASAQVGRRVGGSDQP
jgi:peptide/nickel transport system permease protein